MGSDPLADRARPAATAVAGLRQTKLLRPRLARDAIARPRLLEELNRGVEHSLILVSGPAGFGKTTLLSQWLASNPCPVAWLNLDNRDSVGTFVLHVTAALAALRVDVGHQALGLLNIPGAGHPADLGEVLADELVGIQDDTFLVLDDYDSVQDRGIHEVLAALLSQPPPCLHVVIAARADPPLPLHRLRARGQLLEVRASDLRFTPEESVRFLHQTLEVPREAADVDLVAESTEGWAAGLRLATIVMRGQSPMAEVAAAFAQRRQAMAMDYLLKEVLERQPAPLRDMLLRTAVVDRLCDSLCDALLTPSLHDGSTPGGLGQACHVTGEALIAAVVEANLFITPMDDVTARASLPSSEELNPGESPYLAWYRYHAMFRAALLHELRLRYGPEDVAALHAAASVWFAEHGYIEEGVQQALAADDGLAAAVLVERHIHPLIVANWLTLDHWLAQLPDALCSVRPALVLAGAWIAYRRGEFQSIPTLVAAAQALLDEGSEPEGDPASLSERRALSGEIAALTAVDRLFHGDSPGCLQAANQALSSVPLSYDFVRGTAASFAAIAALTVDGWDGPSPWLIRIQQTPSGAPQAGLPGVGWASIVGGRLAQAELAGHLLLNQADAAGLPHAWGHALVGLVKYEWNDLEGAADHFQRAFAQPEHMGFLLYRECTFGLALTLQAKGQFGEAADVLERLEAPLLKAANADQLAAVDAFRVRLALLRGDARPAQRYLRSDVLVARNWLSTLVEAPPLTRLWASLFLNPQMPRSSSSALAAVAELDNVVNESEQSHATKRLVEALALRSLALELSDQRREALESLGRAVDLAEPGGMLRTFVDMGPPLARLLDRLSARHPPSTYLQQLTAACAPAERPALPDSGLELADSPVSPPTSSHELLDTLTDRELEVLRRLARRLTNKEIGAELYISELTVKRHAANLFGKLGANSRRQAVRQAITLGLIPSG